MATAQEVLAIAASQIGYSRWDDPQQGTKYGRWFAELTGDAYYGQNGVPYCAMFVSWVLAQARQQCAGFPGAYCPTMLAAARRAGLAVAYKDARLGDVVFFDWDGGVSDHVGFVELNKGNYYQTIEGNTSAGASGSQGNGGVVARRTRALSTVCGVIRPPYAAAIKDDAGSGALAVDGILGKQSVSKWQRVMGTPVDGIVSGQWEPNAKWYPALEAVEFDDGSGSALVRAVQRATGAEIDGILGPQTIKAIQQHLGLKTGADGFLGPTTAKAIQRMLNTGRF